MPTNSHAMEPEELMAYLDGELPATKAAMAAEHLAHCRECQAVAADLQSVSRRLMAWQVEAPEFALRAGLEEPPKKVGRRTTGWTKVYWGAGILAACLVLLVVTTPVNYQRVADVRAPRRQGLLGGIVGIVAPSEPLPAQTESINGPLIIHTAQITLTTIDFAKTRDALEALVRQHGGHVGQLSVSSPTGAARSLQATLRIPADHLEAFMAELRKLGRVEMESQAGEEVTSQVVDLEARLSNSRITEQRLAEILRQRTGKISDVLEVEKEIGRVRGEIERMTAERKNLGDRVAYSTVQASISEEYKAELQSPSSLGQLRNAAVEGYRNVAGSLVTAALLLLSTGPTLLLWAAILFFPGRFLWRRYRRAR